MKSIHIFLSVLFLLVASGCATAPKTLAPSMKSQIHDVSTILTMPQNEIEVTVTTTDGSKAGLLGVLVAGTVDSIRESKAKKRAKPIIAGLRGYDFRQTMLKSTQHALSHVQNFNISTPAFVEKSDKDLRKKNHVEVALSDAVLFINVKYFYESDVLRIIAVSTLVPKKEALIKNASKDKFSPTNLLFQRNYEFKSRDIDATNVQAKLVEGANDIGMRIANDLRAMR